VKEHRKFIRLHAPIGLVYRYASRHKSRKARPTLVRNLSGGGVSFVVRDPLRAGEIVELELQIPNLSEPVRATGEVVWFRQAAGHAAHEAAVRFTDVNPVDLNRILEYVYAVGIG